MEKNKTATFIQNNKYLIMAFIFQYICPLILLCILAGQSKSASVGLKLWGSVVGVILLVAYFCKGKQWVSEKKTQEKIDSLKVPVWIRVVQMCISLLVIFIIYLIVSTTKIMFDEVVLFIICAGVSVFIGHCFLIVDSKNRVAHKITRN